MGDTREATTRRISGEMGVCARIFRTIFYYWGTSGAYLVVGDVVVRTHPLDLRWCKHPAYVVDDL